MSTSPTTQSTSSAPTTSSIRSKKYVCPKVWKRPHSTIYGKNVEFGSSLYSDKIGELNGRKFNSELPWSVRNSGGSTSASGSSSSVGQYNQGYLSNNNYSLLVDHPSTSTFAPISTPDNSMFGRNHKFNNYADLLEMTNPNRTSKRKQQRQSLLTSGNSNKRIDFYDQYDQDFSKEIDRLNNSSLMMNEPLLTRKVFDNFLDFDHELGLFVPNHDNYDSRDDRSLTRKNTLMNKMNSDNINTKSFVPLPTKLQNTELLPKHECQLMSSPYGPSTDGRKLSLGSINPQSYRPSLPHKTTTAHASDGEEFEFHDKSSPFYTDRWAGKTIRHFDSDLYSDAHLFKSMIL